jgi:membrane-associated phospholipid phosphatase
MMQPNKIWYRQIATALTRHIWLKAIGTPLFIAVFFGAYIYLLKNPVYPITVMPMTWLDRWVPFQPWTMSFYVSLWVYVSLPSALLATRRELFIYSGGMTATCLTGLLIFYFWPTAVPVANIDWALYPGVDYLKSLDAAGNACPSLHVATAVFSALWLHFTLARFTAPRWLRSLNWTWCIGIVYSTVATRQHVAVDVLAGLVLGGLFAYASLRRSQRHPSTVMAAA